MNDSAQASAWFTAEALPDTGLHTGLAVGTHRQAVAMLSERGFDPLSVRDLAAHRLVLGPYHQISWTGSRTTDLLLVDGDQMWLAHGHADGDLFQADTAPLYEGFHADGNEIPLDEDAFEESIAIPSTNFDIPVEELTEHPVAQFLLGDLAEDYQEWLRSISITHLPFMVPPLSLARHYPHPFMRPLIMRCTDNWSGLITVNADLYNAYGYRAVSDDWDGPTQPEETFTPATLRAVRDLLDLEDRSYTLSEMVKAAGKVGHLQSLGTALRVIRGSSDLPASHATFAPSDAADTD